MKITITPFETAAGFEYMRVKITVAFVKEYKKKINFWEYLRPPSSEYFLSRLMRFRKSKG
jgi:hypothetical protein